MDSERKSLFRRQEGRENAHFVADSDRAGALVDRGGAEQRRDVRQGQSAARRGRSRLTRHRGSASWARFLRWYASSSSSLASSSVVLMGPDRFVLSVTEYAPSRNMPLPHSGTRRSLSVERVSRAPSADSHRASPWDRSRSPRRPSAPSESNGRRSSSGPPDRCRLEGIAWPGEHDMQWDRGTVPPLAKLDRLRPLLDCGLKRTGKPSERVDARVSEDLVRLGDDHDVALARGQSAANSSKVSLMRQGPRQVTCRALWKWPRAAHLDPGCGELRSRPGGCDGG